MLPPEALWSQPRKQSNAFGSSKEVNLKFICCQNAIWISSLFDKCVRKAMAISSGYMLRRRLLSKVEGGSLSFEIPLGFKEAEAYRKANGQYLRKNQWRDTTVTVYVDLD